MRAGSAWSSTVPASRIFLSSKRSRELCRSDDAVPTLLRAVAPTWLLQLPWLSTAEERDALRRELAGVGPERMLREMGELLDRYTERRPLLLVTEDLHWSDRATMQLIDYIARRRGSARLMWLASFRLAEVIARTIRSTRCGTSCACMGCARRSCSMRSPKARWPNTWRSACRRWRPTKRSCARCTSAPTACRCSWRRSLSDVIARAAAQDGATLAAAAQLAIWRFRRT